jgi:hypothetical protein
MSETDKLMAFGSWLSAKKIQHSNELYSLSLNTRLPVDNLRIKAGHLEATQHILEAFTLLYKQDLGKFMREYMGSDPDAEEKESKDGSNV